MNASTQVLAFAPISAVAESVRKKELSPVELVRASLARIEALDPKLNSFYTLFRDDAMAAARAAEAEIARGQYRGPLHGIPIGIKDIYECGPTTCGSKSLKDYVAAEDCTAVRKLKQSGALVVGKNATYEFAYGFPTTKSYFKPARNPWNLAYDAGGSSSGSGSSVSAGLVYASMGSCTGGSIRWPAQCCGIVGLKATYGRVSRMGVYPLAWSLDHTGPLARTVKDAALMLQGCAGYDPADPASANVPVPDFSAGLGQPIKGMRIGLMRSVYEDNCDPKILGPFNAALGEFEKLGATDRRRPLDHAHPDAGDRVAGAVRRDRRDPRRQRSSSRGRLQSARQAVRRLRLADQRRMLPDGAAGARPGARRVARGSGARRRRADAADGGVPGKSGARRFAWTEYRGRGFFGVHGNLQLHRLSGDPGALRFR